MLIATYVFIGAVIMALVDFLCIWLKKQPNVIGNFDFTNTERVIVIAFWPIVILFAVINIILNRTNQN
jgi:hypothetical protein